MARKEEYTVEQVIEALQKTAGVKSQAARRLGCDRMTIHRYCERYPEINQAYKNERESLIDVGESKLIKMVQDEGHSHHYNSVRFLLQTIGRERGWNENYEVDIANIQGAAEALDIDLSNLDKDELRMLRSILKKAKKKSGADENEDE